MWGLNSDVVKDDLSFDQGDAEKSKVRRDPLLQVKKVKLQVQESRGGNGEWGKLNPEKSLWVYIEILYFGFDDLLFMFLVVMKGIFSVDN